MNECPDDSRCADEAARLLPWYVAGRLGANDSGRVAQHLEHCAICRDDVLHERSVRTLLKSESSLEYAPQPGLAKTLARIDEFEREGATLPRSAAHPAPRPVRRFGAVHWLSAAAAVQAIALSIVGATLFHHSVATQREPRYVTMSSSAAPVASVSRIRVVFSPDMSLGALQSLLAHNALTIIHGPSAAGAYTLTFTDARAASQPVDPVIAALRSDARVMFVEPAVIDEVSAQ
ncbi:MAG: zf-HC2 domain-containing protein [Steroidobacteraceae bacterium]|jgi:anti-sigma factor RsiW